MNSTDLSTLSTSASLAVSSPTGHASSIAPSPAAPSPTKTAGTFHCEESLLDFAHWLAVIQNIPAQLRDDSLQLEFVEQSRRRRKNVQVQTMSTDSLLSVKTVDDLPEALTLLIASFRDGGAPAHLRPTGTVDAVHAVTEKLFPAYDVEEGSVHLQGCQLEPRPFVRISFLVANEDRARIQHIYVAPDGSSVSQQLGTKLSLAESEPLESAPARIANNQLDALVGAGRRMAAQLQNARDPAASAGNPLAVAVVWVRYAAGQLRFEIGQSSAKLPFEGWIRDLKAPKFSCPATGIETFRLTALDDGRIVAAEQAANCEKSGTRALQSELTPCCVTGKQVLPEFTTVCPILGQPALTDNFVSCARCQEEVCTAAVTDGVCQACLKLTTVKKTDPRLNELIQRYPGLASRKWWQIAETTDVTIVVASHLFSQTLIVCDRSSMEVKHLATRRRGASGWVSVDAAKRQEILGA